MSYLMILSTIFLIRKPDSILVQSVLDLALNT